MVKQRKVLINIERKWEYFRMREREMEILENEGKREKV